MKPDIVLKIVHNFALKHTYEQTIEISDVSPRTVHRWFIKLRKNGEEKKGLLIQRVTGDLAKPNKSPDGHIEAGAHKRQHRQLRSLKEIDFPDNSFAAVVGIPLEREGGLDH